MKTAVATLLRLLLPEEIALLRALADQPGTVSVERLRGTRLERLLQDPLIFDSDARIRVIDPLDPDLIAELREVLQHVADPACSHLSHTDIPRQIERAQAQSDFAQAERLLHQGGGPYLVHVIGPRAFLRLVNGFPEDHAGDSELIMLSRAMLSLKTGDLNRAHRLIEHHFGPEALDLRSLVRDRRKYSPLFCLFRLVMAIYEDTEVPKDLRPDLFEFLAAFSPDDHLHRGSFYNAMLDVVVRSQEYEAAREIATRARFHYDKANIPILVFYIDLYLSIIELRTGALSRAEDHARHAATSLSHAAFETPSDLRILGLLQAVISYEKGSSQPLLRFAQHDFNQFAYGEIWPTLAQLAISYGSQALARHVALPAARDYLERWRVQEWRSNRFRYHVSLMEVSLLQSVNRWQEAEERLAAMPTKLTTAWFHTAQEDLRTLKEHNDIALVVLWMRQLAWGSRDAAHVRAQIRALLLNERLSEHQTAQLLLLSAHLARKLRHLTEARMEFNRAVEIVDRTGYASIFFADAEIVRRLANDSRIGKLMRNPGTLRHVLKRLSGVSASLLEGAQAVGLTPQEIKVLLLVVEGGSNKHVARQLGLAEVTVKFHLSNGYRKLGCRTRREAVEIAHNNGWVS